MTRSDNVASPVAEPAAPGRRPAAAATKRGRGRRSTASTHNLFGFLLIAPLVLVVVVVIGFPLVNTLVLSLQDQGVIGSESSFVGFDSFATVLSETAFWDSLRRSAVWLFGNLFIQTVLAFATALLLMRRSWWSRTARTWIVLPWVIPTVAVAVIWQWLTNTSYGIVTDLAGLIGINLGGAFASTDSALFALILINSWHWFPLAAVVIYGALNTIPLDVLEAARIDGANAWQMFWHVIFPLLQPILFALGLVGSLWTFNIVDSIFLVTEGGPAGASTTAPIFIYHRAFSAFRTSEAAAASVTTIILLGIVVYLFIKLARPKDDA